MTKENKFALPKFVINERINKMINTCDSKHEHLFRLQIFQGNWDNDTVIRKMFPRRIFARFIRFNPVSYTGGYICMRVEIYECLPTEGKVILQQTKLLCFRVEHRWSVETTGMCLIDCICILSGELQLTACRKLVSLGISPSAYGLERYR